MVGTDMARAHPTTAARVVILAHRGGGDVRNAWEVLVSAWGPPEASALLRAVAAQEYPTEAGDIVRAHGLADYVEGRGTEQPPQHVLLLTRGDAAMVAVGPFGTEDRARQFEAWHDPTLYTLASQFRVVALIGPDADDQWRDQVNEVMRGE